MGTAGGVAQLVTSERDAVRCVVCCQRGCGVARVSPLRVASVVPGFSPYHAQRYAAQRTDHVAATRRVGQWL